LISNNIKNSLSNDWDSQHTKEKISDSIEDLKIQQNRLENIFRKMQKYNEKLFDRCVSSQMTEDFTRAKMYANECVKVRKIAALVLKSQLFLEVISTRLEIIREFGSE
jgi:division protein CdvB (Snf7/Vps24/ESCRT-III family)